MEFMRIGGIFGPAISRFINKTVRSKTGVDPDIRIEEMSISQTNTPDKEEFEPNRVEVVFKATMSEDELQRLLMEVTK
jgi:hypothetical protein